MSDEHLNDFLSGFDVPKPRAGLKAEILAAAKDMPQALPAANDGRARTAWLRSKTVWMSGAAAIAAAFVMVMATPSAELDPLEQTETYAELASDMGYDDLYAWLSAETEDDGTAPASQFIQPVLLKSL